MSRNADADWRSIPVNDQAVWGKNLGAEGGNIHLLILNSMKKWEVCSQQDRKPLHLYPPGLEECGMFGWTAVVASVHLAMVLLVTYSWLIWTHGLGAESATWLRWDNLGATLRQDDGVGSYLSG